MRGIKPSIEEIKEQVEKCDKIYGPLWGAYKEDNTFYELNFKDRLNLPREYQADGIVLPTARDVVDVAVNHTDITNARVFVNKKGTSDIAASSANMLRKLGLGILHMINVEAQIAPGHVGAKHFWLHGLAVFKTFWDADRWIDKPLQKEGESDEDYAIRLDEWRAISHLSLPIIIQAINPANIMPDPYYGGQLYVIERHKKLLFDAKRIWPHWDNPNNRGIDEEVEYISYWDKDYRCDLVDGEPVLKIKGGVVNHRYGFIPYTLIESGLGNLDENDAPEKRYVGILRYIKDLLISESLNYSLCNILMKWETMKGGYTTGADAATMPDVKQVYGEYWNVGDKDVVFHDWERKLAPEASYAHLALTHEYIAAHAAPRSARGLSEVGVRSGADRRLIMAAASAIYQYATPAFAAGWSNILNKCARLVKNVIPGDFEIWSMTPTDEFDVSIIKKSQLREPFNYYIEFAPISEEDEYTRQDNLRRSIQAGLLTPKEAWKQLSNVDPERMEIEVQKEKIRNSPNYMAVLDQSAAGKLAEAISKRQGAESLSEGGMPQAPPGQTPPGEQEMIGGMVPPIPERARPGSAEEMQLRLKQLRSQTPMFPGQGRGGGGATRP